MHHSILTTMSMLRFDCTQCPRPIIAAPFSARQGSVDSLKAAITNSHPKLYSSRQRLTLPPEAGQRSGAPLADGKALQDYGLTDGSVVFCKDLGTQAGMNTQ